MTVKESYPYFLSQAIWQYRGNSRGQFRSIYLYIYVYKHEFASQHFEETDRENVNKKLRTLLIKKLYTWTYFGCVLELYQYFSNLTFLDITHIHSSASLLESLFKTKADRHMKDTLKWPSKVTGRLSAHYIKTPSVLSSRKFYLWVWL